MWSSAVHGCQLVMIKAAAPNLLQVRAGRRFHLQFYLRIALLPDKLLYATTVRMLTEHTQLTADSPLPLASVEAPCVLH
jgi:hypothetical protein